ncbi:Uncharacterized protein dnl_60210 [Desulfonema limicola]|uniref:VCBS repeat-containing protein n=2 Tax=Desulfonema limicola TaxID=45656 RepID=A0A975GKA3_9BACT|nr:Uncharacterized protein dnl_60210 [Desulfonema limicola]
MSDPNTGDSRYYENIVLSQNQSFQFEESGSYFNEGPADPNKPLKYKVVARSQIDGQWYELGHHDISVVLFPNSSTIKTVRRVGNIAWYPSDKSCEEASEWYDLSKPPSSASQTVSICSELQQELERISESANPSQEIPEDFFWQTWLKALLEILDFFGLKISAEKIMDFFIIQEISIPLASEASPITIISGSGLSPIDATGFGYELKPIELLPEPGLPDFVTTEVHLKTTSGEEKYVYDKYEQIQIHAWFENIGDADWAGSDDEMEVRFYLSSGYKEDSHSEWIRIGKETIQKDHLKLGDSPDHEEESLKLWEYPEIKQGNFYNIVACADRIEDKDNGDGAIPEKHKSNNCSSEAVFFVKPQPLSHDWKTFLLSDVNGDSYADALKITPEAEKFEVWRSRSNFYLSNNTWYDGPFDYSIYFFLSGDVNGDGLSDTVGISPSDERFVVWNSNGTGFNSGVEWLNGIYDYNTYEFRMADVNGDGYDDIIGIWPKEERFVVWTSNGKGFNSGVEWLNGTYEYSDYAFQLGDVNGDGTSDIVGLNPINQRFVVWASSGSSFLSGVEWKYGVDNFTKYQFDLSDVNGDGKDDIVAVSAGQESFWVWLSSGNYFKDGAQWYNGEYDYSSYSFHADDVNGDGRGDIVAYNSSLDRYVVWLSNGSGFSAGVEWYKRGGVQWFNGPFDYSCCEFKLKDINGDKKSDIVSLSPSTERFVAWSSSGISFQDGYQFYDGPFDYSGYVFYPADVDGDGDGDILGMSPLYERFVVWLSNNGVFAGGGEWYDGPFNYSDYIFQPGDFNGDGKDDVLAIWPEKERFVVWLSNGSSFPYAAEWFYGIWDYSMTEFQVADVNGDGYDDIVSIYPQGERFVVWTSNGSSFTCVGEWYKGPFDYSSHIFRVADVTGDGKADIVAMHAASERFIVWKSSGVSFLPGAEWYNGPYSYPNYIFEVSDVNGDGIADVVGINPSDERFIVWLSDGKSFGADSRSLNLTEILCDFNCDRKITLADGIIALKVCAGLSPSLYNILNIENVTLPQDNKVGLEEVIYIMQKCAGLK